MDISKMLRLHPLFSGLNDDDLARIATVTVVRHYSDGQMIFQRRQDGSSMLAVVQGQAKISLSSPDGREILLNTIYPGEFFGEMSMIDGKARSADATAIGETTVLIVARSAFMPMLDRHPELAVRLLEILCEKLRETSDAVEAVALFPIPVRLARLLLRLVAQSGIRNGPAVEIDLVWSQTDIAHIIGASRESVNKTLRAWSQQGIVRLDQARITVLRESHLRALAEMP